MAYIDTPPSENRPGGMTALPGRAREVLDRVASGAPLRILSIDGGGYLGLATAKFIECIEQHFNVRFGELFDLLCGTSTGAIIATALANGRSGSEIVHLYETLGSTVFARQNAGIFHAKYKNTALRDALTEQFSTTTFAEILTKGKFLLIPAFNVTTGTPRLFKTDHSPRLTRDSELSLVDVSLASAAAPIYFPLVPLENRREGVTETYCDGGVTSNHPALLGFVEALSELGVPPSQIRLLSLSTPRINLREGADASRVLNRGLWRWRTTLPSILIDSNSRLTHEVLRRLVASYPHGAGPLYHRVEMDNPGIAMDCASNQATCDLKQIGATLAASNDVRKSVSDIWR